MAKKNNSKKEAPAACELAVRAAAGLCSGAALAALYVCSRSGFAALAVPFAAAALCIGLWALFARLVLCRMPPLLHKQFTQPILWALSVPAWLGSACLLLMLPVSFSGEAEEAVALSIMLLEAVLLAPAAALAALVLGVLAVVKAARHLASAQGTRAYTELPLAVSTIALFGTVAMVGFGAWSILH